MARSHPMDERGGAPAQPALVPAAAPAPVPAQTRADPRAMMGAWRAETILAFTCGNDAFAGDEPIRFQGRELTISPQGIEERGRGFAASCPAPQVGVLPGAPVGKTAVGIVQVIAAGSSEPESVISAACPAPQPGRIAPDGQVYRFIQAADDRLLAFTHSISSDETLLVVFGRAERTRHGAEDRLPAELLRWPHCNPSRPQIPAAHADIAQTDGRYTISQPSARPALGGDARTNPFALPDAGAGMSGFAHQPGQGGTYNLPKDLSQPRGAQPGSSDPFANSRPPAPATPVPASRPPATSDDGRYAISPTYRSQ